MGLRSGFEGLCRPGSLNRSILGIRVDRERVQVISNFTIMLIVLFAYPCLLSAKHRHALRALRVKTRLPCRFQHDRHFCKLPDESTEANQAVNANKDNFQRPAAIQRWPQATSQPNGRETVDDVGLCEVGQI